MRWYGDGLFEYPQHMFWLRNKKNNFQLHTHNLKVCKIISMPLKFLPSSLMSTQYLQLAEFILKYS